MDFGTRLKELRTEKGLSQTELGEIFKKSANNISQYETSKREPDLETLINMSDYFDVSLDYLLCKDQNYFEDTDEKTNYKLGDFLISEQKKRKLSLRDFANELGISHSYLKILETGKNPKSGNQISPTIEILNILAKSLNVKIEHIIKLAGYQISDGESNFDSLDKSNNYLDLDFDMLTDEEIDDTFTSYLKKQNRVMFFDPESDRSPEEKRAMLKELTKKEKKRQEKIDKLNKLPDDLLEEALCYAEFRAQKKSNK